MKNFLILILFFGASYLFAHGITLSSEQAAVVGRKIWQNEGAGKTNYLTWWGDKEDFASLGIGHFIWHPANPKSSFTQIFPEFVAFAHEKTEKIPQWLKNNLKQPCPWNNKEEFNAALESEKMVTLRKFLEETIALQTEFMCNRIEQVLPEILAAVPGKEQKLIKKKFYAVASTSNGVYALVDYLNFKGVGTNVAERYNGQGWGLLAVLQTMQLPQDKEQAAEHFAAAAESLLIKRVENAKTLGKDESKWLPGWLNRVRSYC